MKNIKKDKQAVRFKVMDEETADVLMEKLNNKEWIVDGYKPKRKLQKIVTIGGTYYLELLVRAETENIYKGFNVLGDEVLLALDPDDTSIYHYIFNKGTVNGSIFWRKKRK